MDVCVLNLRRSLYNLGYNLAAPTPRPTLHGTLPQFPRTSHRHLTGSRQPARCKEPPLPALPSLANAPRPQNLDPLRHGRRRASPERCFDIIYLDHRRLVRLLHTRDPVSADSGRRCSVPCFACWRLHLHALAEEHKVCDDAGCQRDLYYWGGAACWLA